MKLAISIFILSVCLSANVYAVTCRSGEAAVRGSQSGYEEDKKAAEATVENDLSFSDILGKCVGGVTGIKAGPTYGPSETFGDWADKIFKQVCSIARDKINDTVDGAAESRMGSALQNIYSNYENAQHVLTTVGSGSVPSTSGVISNYNAISAPQNNATQLINAPQDTGTTDSAGSNFLNNIWK
ncbi:hypothetical protein [Pseudomonas siliginis]|uniref:hypothetical protein n=1 Tax=Pseudomonas siliginis TaxID=2842346 RepID=UPI0020934897|nr:hypothetical protein [Pseudomonas siliginis]UST77169.1 hypothetical protein NF676_00445 [Pseudomonas siliginis]